MNNEYLKLLKDKYFLKSKDFKKLKKDINEYIKKCLFKRWINNMNKIKLINKPNFIDNNILKDLINKIYINNKIKNISKIDFRFKECISNNSLVYTLSIECNENATFYNDIKLFSGKDVIIKSMVFRKDENYKPFIYW